MQKTSVILSFLGLWLTSYLSEEKQLFFGFFLILTFGILHGANDILLIHHLKHNKKQNFLRVLASYITVVLISVVLFTQIPIIALVLFIVVSSYHFGEQQWHELLRTEKQLVIKIFEFNYGLLVLLLLFFFNKEEVIKIIFEITNFKITTSLIDINLSISVSFFMILSYIMYRKFENFKKNILKQLFYLVLLGVIFKSSGLIWGFTIYFIFWHSIPSLHDQITFLYGKYTMLHFIKYFKAAFLYWIISLVGIVVLFYVAKDLVIFDALFFSFLASITFPHAIVILKMNAK